jgi:hypothetical protein
LRVLAGEVGGRQREGRGGKGTQRDNMSGIFLLLLT